MSVQTNTSVERHKTAIRRNKLSRPAQLALRDGLIRPDGEFFDYGCGLGEDVEYLKGLGFQASGWDPVHYPQGSPRPADVVNLGYVINVIEDLSERRETLKRAFQLARSVLIASAQVGYFDQQIARCRVYHDGYLTSRNTFQKYYEQDELRQFLRETLKAEPYAAGVGIFYVFRSDEAEANYCRLLLDEQLPERFEFSRQPLALETLQEVAEQVRLRGRLPLVQECPDLGPAIAILGASDDWLGRLGDLISAAELQEIRRGRRRALIGKLARSSFSESGRARMSELSEPERADVRALFGSYTRASQEADRTIDECLRLDAVRDALANLSVGKTTREATYIHCSQEPHLPDPLFVLVQCARGACEEELTGEPTVLKFSASELALSLAYYPDFDEVAHPALERVVRFDFETSTVSVRQYKQRGNPPILHRKELLVDAAYPAYQVFRQLSHQEARLGLLGHHTIGTKQGWERLLAERGVQIEGHSLATNTDTESDNILQLSVPSEVLWEEAEAEETTRRVARRVKRTPTRRAASFPDDVLQLFAEHAIRLGRPPGPDEFSGPKRLAELLNRNQRWREHVQPWFDADRYEHNRRCLWERLILSIGTALFEPGGRRAFKKLEPATQTDVRSIFGSYLQACAEADTWMRKMGDPGFVEAAILNCGLGRFVPEKGLYLHVSLRERLPLVLKLLIQTAQLFADVAMPPEVDIIRISPDGSKVKFYHHEAFDQPGPSRRLETCKVLFRYRKVISSSYRDTRQHRILEDKWDLVASEHPLFQSRLASDGSKASTVG